MTQSDIITWSLVLIGLLMAGFVAASLVKRRMSQPEQGTAGGFTLSDLRAMHKSGKMTDDEFAKAKEAIVGATRRAVEQELKQKEQRVPPRPRPPGGAA